MSLENQLQALNQGRKVPQRVIRYVDKYKSYQGSIPLNVPTITQDGRRWISGIDYLPIRTQCLQSQTPEQVKEQDIYLNLADSCITFEDKAKIQTQSPLLTQIQGIVDTSDGPQVAIPTEAVNSAIKRGTFQYFEPHLREQETATYSANNQEQTHQVTNVVLFPFINRNYIQLTPEQYQAIKTTRGNEFTIDDTFNRDLAKDEIIEKGKVIHKGWKSYPSGIVIPLVNEVFKFNQREYSYDKNMGFYLPSNSKKPELRAAYLVMLYGRSGLSGVGHLGVGGARLFGVVENVAEGDAQNS